jgi:hypothetical protein
MVASTFAQITTLLLEIIGTRRTNKKEEEYLQIALIS